MHIKYIFISNVMSHFHRRQDYRLNVRLTSPEKLFKFIQIQVCKNKI